MRSLCGESAPELAAFPPPRLLSRRANKIQGKRVKKIPIKVCCIVQGALSVIVGSSCGSCPCGYPGKCVIFSLSGCGSIKSISNFCCRASVTVCSQCFLRVLYQRYGRYRYYPPLPISFIEHTIFLERGVLRHIREDSSF